MTLEECQRCKSRTSDTRPIRYCRACARYLEGTYERESIQKENEANIIKAAGIAINIIAHGILVLDVLEEKDRTISNVMEGMNIYASKLRRESNVITEKQAELSDILIDNLFQDLIRNIVRKPWTVQPKVEETTEATERIFDLLDYGEPIQEESNVQVWDWNPDDERDWADDYDIGDYYDGR